MIVQRRIAVVMILIQLGLFAYLSKTMVFPACMGVIAALSLLQWWSFHMTQGRVVIYGLLLGILFYGRWYLSPFNSTIINVYFMDLGYSLTQYFITLQVILLYLRREQGLYLAFPLLGVAALMTTGDIMPSAPQNMVYHTTIIIFVALCAFYFSATRQRQFIARPRAVRITTQALILVVVLGLGATTNTLLSRYQYELDAAFNNLMYPLPTALETGTGLSQQVRLGSVARRKGEEGETVAVRVYSEEPPGYLRGRAFDDYRNTRWETSTTNREIAPLDPDARPERLFPLVREQSVSKATSIEIWPNKALANTVFTDLHTSQVEAPTDVLHVNPHNIVSGTGMRPSAPYTLYPTVEPSMDTKPSQEMIQYLLEVPEDIDPGIVALADSVFEGADSPESKIINVIGYFNREYTYTIGINVPPDEDPLTFFLLEKPAAHCEYFASGAAILLRLGGVPTRYVTGYVVREENPVGGYWVGRSRDAHAWVEAWVDGTGWVQVEATPANGVPQGEEFTGGGYRWDDFKHRVTQLKEALVGGAVSEAFRATGLAVKQAIMALVTSGAGWIAILFGASFVVWRWRRKRIAFQMFNIDDPNAELHSMLQTMDATLVKAGLARTASETLHGFARRIEGEDALTADLRPAGKWYRMYAAIRYRRNIHQPDMEMLQRDAESLIGS